MKKRILITGALGHIGSKLIHELQPGEFSEIRIIDDLSTKRYPSLFFLSRDVNFSFVEADLLSTDLVRLTENIDIVIHLAAITDATTSFDIPEEIERVNYLGTKHVADACAKNGAKLFFPSTTSVYGVQNAVVDEACPQSRLNPQSPYATAKLRSENLLQELASKHNLEFVTCRLGTIFGSSIGMRFHTAVNKFCWQACVGTPLTVWKTALDQKRPYLGLSDAVRSIKHLITANLFDGEIYNVVSSNHTVREIIDQIRHHVENVEIELVETEIMNQLSYEVRNEKIISSGFTFRDDLAVGISETINMLKNMNSVA